MGSGISYPASDAALGSLSAIAPQELPVEYYRLLSHSNGGEGPLPVDSEAFVPLMGRE